MSRVEKQTDALDGVVHDAAPVGIGPGERNGVVLERRTDRAPDGRVNAECLTHDRVEERELIQRGKLVRTERRVVRGCSPERLRAALGPQLFLEGQVRRELEQDPRE
jgi:hypothetical protein